MTFLRSLRSPPDHHRRFGSDRGATAVEYALLVAGVALVMIVGVAFLGSSIGGGVASAAEAMSGAGAGVDAGRRCRAGAAEQAAAEQAAAEQAAAEQAAAEQAAAEQAARRLRRQPSRRPPSEAARVAAEEQARIATEKAAEDARIAAEQQAAADQAAADKAAADRLRRTGCGGQGCGDTAAAERAKDIQECEAKKGYSWNYATDTVRQGQEDERRLRRLAPPRPSL